MNDWQQTTEAPKTAGDIIAQLWEEMAEANLRFASGGMQHDEWAAEMRGIDQRLHIFGLALDRPERFAGRARVL